MAFAELHAHTMMSNLKAGRDSINRIPDLVDCVQNMGHKGLAITEHDCIVSHLDAVEYVKKKKAIDASFKDFKIILGNEIYLTPNDVCKESPASYYPHFILNALDEEGHKQIRQLSTAAWGRGFMQNALRAPTHYADLEKIIGKNQGHVVGSSACMGGALPRHLLAARNAPTVEQRTEIRLECEGWIQYINNIFGQGNFFLELQPSNNPDQIYVNNQLVYMAKNQNIPFIITNDVHYLRPEDRPIHKAFLQAQETEREVDDFYETTYCKSESEMKELLSYLEDDIIEEGFANTVKIADRVQEYELKKPLQIPYMCLDYREPDINLFMKYKEKIPSLSYFFTSKHDADRHLCREIVKRIDNDEQYQNQETYDELESELQTVIECSDAIGVRWSAYFLTEQNIVNLIWEAGEIVGCGRGSGVGFLLLNLLGITQINPLREKAKTEPWRFLNPARASTSVLDIDIDIPQAGRENVLQKFRNTFGVDHVSQVLTLGTEKSKSAILTACRGLGVNNDYAQYLASLIVADRGQLRTLHQMYYGDPEQDMQPNKVFINEMDAHPEIWETALKIEGLVRGSGVHAGGIILDDVPFDEHVSLMKTNSLTTVTGATLHQAEDMSLIKFDVLSIAALDKIKTCLELLVQDGLIEWQGNLKSTYEKYLGVYNLVRDDIEMWKLAWDHKVISLFQMEKESGKEAIRLVKPSSVEELAQINSVMRLMSSEKGGERPLEKLARFKNDISLWYQEMTDYGLTEDEQKLLEPMLLNDYGIMATQEAMMSMVMIPEIGGFDLLWADTLRKAVAKKIGGAFDKCEKEFYENAKQKGLSQNLVHYVWDVLISTLKGYGFNEMEPLYGDV